MNIKEEINKLILQKQLIDEQIAYLKNQCSHNNVEENAYVDYDRN